MKFFILAASFAALVTANTKNFSGSCSNIRIFNGRDRPEVLQATCNTLDGTTAEAELQLVLCLGAVDGKLQYQDRGFFVESCSDCALSGGTTVYTCNCGGDTLTAIDLNTVVGNENGKLACGPP
ncbi:hypothetical protein NM208_g194 [Fusarium decemcellulare]|uniref:Uncharacterized protein n=1 Tax=Fusarium decemcellulare TaxID=57161 RepID=A0ACC1T0I6_9HYPO|nr:hypothetical protein NM208_g194 [Fusarium decemcellulare]